MTTKVTPFLMFEGDAEEAMNFYVSLIPESRILDVKRYGVDGPGPEGSLLTASFLLGDLTVMCSNSPTPHDFTFTPSMSLFITCSSEAEIAELTEVLCTDGKTLMPLDNYGFSQKFAWVDDRFGVSWQLNLD